MIQVGDIFENEKGKHIITGVNMGILTECFGLSNFVYSMIQEHRPNISHSELQKLISRHCVVTHNGESSAIQLKPKRENVQCIRCQSRNTHCLSDILQFTIIAEAFVCNDCGGHIEIVYDGEISTEHIKEYHYTKKGEQR